MHAKCELQNLSFQGQIRKRFRTCLRLKFVCMWKQLRILASSLKTRSAQRHFRRAAELILRYQRPNCLHFGLKPNEQNRTWYHNYLIFWNPKMPSGSSGQAIFDGARNKHFRIASKKTIWAFWPQTYPQFQLSNRNWTNHWSAASEIASFEIDARGQLKRPKRMWSQGVRVFWRHSFGALTWHI